MGTALLFLQLFLCPRASPLFLPLLSPADPCRSLSSSLSLLLLRVSSFISLRVSSSFIIFPPFCLTLCVAATLRDRFVDQWRLRLATPRNAIILVRGMRLFFGTEKLFCLGSSPWCVRDCESGVLFQRFFSFFFFLYRYFAFSTRLFDF